MISAISSRYVATPRPGFAAFYVFSETKYCDFPHHFLLACKSMVGYSSTVTSILLLHFPCSYAPMS